MISFITSLPLLAILALWTFTAASTDTHEPGYCALYGQCGKKSIFGKDLPCEANVKASVPTQEEKALLKDICGWEDPELVCCDLDQLQTMKEQLGKAGALIASCPACKENFYQFFCQFTCSSDQSTFVNVTATGVSMTGQTVVTELDEYVLGDYASKFFDSCKNIKFSVTNGYAMDLIGGGAKTYQQFLKFLGDEKPLLGGSPFQINFLYDNKTDSGDEFNLLNATAYDCNDETYKCACPDCEDACPAVPDIAIGKVCHVGILPCFSFAVIMVYSVMILMVCFIYYYKYSYKVSPLFSESFVDDVDGTEDDEQDSSSEYNITLSRRYALYEFIGKLFGKIGFFCALYPKSVIVTSLVITAVLSSFIAMIQLEKNPVNLWVSSEAAAFKQKQHFDEYFGPFYRTQQIFLVNETGPIIDNYETLVWWFAKEKEIREIVVSSEGGDIGLQNICFMPTGEACIVESFTQYFHGELSAFPSKSQYMSKLKSCMDSPVTCLPDFQQPLNKNLLFGGFSDENAMNANTIVVTILLNNDVDAKSKQVQDSEIWEEVLENFLIDLSDEISEKFSDLRLSFNTESSLEKELNKSTNTDVKIIVISYLVMFAYASLALGGIIPDFDAKTWTKTKFSLGLIGVVIVLLSVASSAGICALFGIKSTLIIAEVIPFLVLAIGVDNIFLITNDFKKTTADLPANALVEEIIGVTMAKIGPSIFLSAISQFLCFSLATMVSMPAVRNFAVYCAGAVVINALLQLTTFISVLALDEKRYRQGRLDIFPFLKLKESVSSHENQIVPQLLRDDDNEANSLFHRLMQRYFTPFVLKKSNKGWILALFVAWFGISLTLLPEIKLGLDQRIAIPSDSFLIDYFNDIYSYLNVGPPIYFVVDDLNLTETENQQKVCGKFASCNEFSFGNIMEQEYNKDDNFIAEPLSSWLDDFFLWLNPDMDECCRVKKIDDDVFCSPTDPMRPCEACYAHKDYDYANMSSFPHGQDFLKYFNQWIESPSDPCPLGGKAPYSKSVQPDFEENGIKSSVFRTSHAPLRSQDDFIDAYSKSLKLVDTLKSLTKIEHIYAYSPFYIFFVQYETIVGLTFTLISAALGVTFIASSIMLGSIRISLILIATVVSILVNIGGLMSLCGISLNAVSLVNLIICIGLAVEFCVHIVRDYMFTDMHIEMLSGAQESSRRAQHTLSTVGGSVFGGITMTKLIGVIVLAFTRSKIFEVYYFRMWASLIFVASLHSLVLLPIVLSYIGGPGYFYVQEKAPVGDDLLSRLRTASGDNYGEDED